MTDQFRRYSIPFFQSIPALEIKRLSSLCVLKSFPKNNILFREGSKGEEFFLIVYGCVSIEKQVENRNGVPFEDDDIKKMEMNCDSNQKISNGLILGPGRYFGEIALVTDSLRTVIFLLILSVRQLCEHKPFQYSSPLLASLLKSSSHLLRLHMLNLLSGYQKTELIFQRFLATHIQENSSVNSSPRSLVLKIFK